MVLLQLTSQNAHIGAPNYLQSYYLVRLDRNRHGGGVFLYIRNALSYSVTFIGLDNKLVLATLLSTTMHTYSRQHYY